MGKKSWQASTTMIGHGTVRAVPDLIRVTLSVESRADTVAAAYGRAGDRVAAVVTALRAAGVSDADMATSGLSVRTETVYTDNGRSEITGYLASSGLSVSLRDDTGTDPADTVAAAVAAGGDDVRLGGLTRGIADPEPLLTQARDAAFDDAKAKAEQYATRAGVALGAVVQITEDTATPLPRGYDISAEMGAPMLMAKASSPVPVVPGETEIGAIVRVTWALE
ncbi:SIMPL domain-containing protein [Nocardia neocaledoniensis]|uniref:SIMPL domain-containing protein n=1 Tax=Nocardia neocaledoniensis TaxID=236511 RepID=UPI002458908A|nr:SIMPL domain-containing protein [Nocardia neocaledoniensis]